MPTILFFALLTFFVSVFPHLAEAQRGKVPRIGYLTGTSLVSFQREAFRQGLRDLGYIEGENISIEWRAADSNPQRQRDMAAELVALKVDVIVTAGSSSTRAARDATSGIPTVMTQDSDPVGSGVIESLSRPGGNITGMSSLAPELSEKRLEIIKEVVPNLTNVANFKTSTSAGAAQELKHIELAAAALNLSVHHVEVASSRQIESGFRAAVQGRAGAALWNVSGSIASSQRKEITAFAAKHRLPVTYQSPFYVDAGGLMFYGVNSADLTYRAAIYVDKILKGAKPAMLPVEQPTKFELVINLKAAKQIGLTIPPNVLARADRLIR